MREDTLEKASQLADAFASPDVLASRKDVDTALHLVGSSTSSKALERISEDVDHLLAPLAKRLLVQLRLNYNKKRRMKINSGGLMTSSSVAGSSSPINLTSTSSSSSLLEEIDGILAEFDPDLDLCAQALQGYEEEARSVAGQQQHRHANASTSSSSSAVGAAPASTTSSMGCEDAAGSTSKMLSLEKMLVARFVKNLVHGNDCLAPWTKETEYPNPDGELEDDVISLPPETVNPDFQAFIRLSVKPEKLGEEAVKACSTLETDYDFSAREGELDGLAEDDEDDETRTAETTSVNDKNHEPNKRFEIECQLLILAYHCFVAGCYQKHLLTVLKLLKRRIKVYARKNMEDVLLKILYHIPEPLPEIFKHFVQTRGKEKPELLFDFVRELAKDPNEEELFSVDEEVDDTTNEAATEQETSDNKSPGTTSASARNSKNTTTARATEADAAGDEPKQPPGRSDFPTVEDHSNTDEDDNSSSPDSTHSSARQLEDDQNKMITSTIEMQRVAFVRFLQDAERRKTLPFEVLVQCLDILKLNSQLAELLYTRGMQQLKKLPRNWRELCSQENEGNLLLILSLFLQAGKKFELCERLEKHLECCRVAALISVQLKGIQVHLAVALQELNQADEKRMKERDRLIFQKELEAEREMLKRRSAKEEKEERMLVEQQNKLLKQETNHLRMMQLQNMNMSNSNSSSAFSLAGAEYSTMGGSGQIIPLAANSATANRARRSVLLGSQNASRGDDDVDEMNFIDHGEFASSSNAVGPNDFELGRTPSKTFLTAASNRNSVVDDEQQAVPVVENSSSSSNYAKQSQQQLNNDALRSRLETPVKRAGTGDVDAEDKLQDQDQQPFLFVGETADNEGDDNPFEGQQQTASTIQIRRRSPNVVGLESRNRHKKDELDFLLAPRSPEQKKEALSLLEKDGAQDSTKNAAASRSRRGANSFDGSETTNSDASGKMKLDGDDNEFGNKTNKGEQSSRTVTTTSAFGPSLLSPDLILDMDENEDEDEKLSSAGSSFHQNKRKQGANPSTVGGEMTSSHEVHSEASSTGAESSTPSTSAKHGNKSTASNAAGTSASFHLGGGPSGTADENMKKNNTTLEQQEKEENINEPVSCNTTTKRLMQKLLQAEKMGLKNSAATNSIGATTASSDVDFEEMNHESKKAMIESLRPISDADPFLVLNLTRKEFETFCEYHCDYLCVDTVVSAYTGTTSRNNGSGYDLFHDQDSRPNAPATTSGTSSSSSGASTSVNETTTTPAAKPTKEPDALHPTEERPADYPSSEITDDGVSIWAKCLFRQVIVNRNLIYLALFLDSRELTPLMVQQTIDLYKKKSAGFSTHASGGKMSAHHSSAAASSHHAADHQSNDNYSTGAKLFLRTAVTNLEQRLKFAKELKFDDIVAEVGPLVYDFSAIVN
ncbi:unnamed protein product [Amoebophrya sp. A120]|nr:unnamed protein product [Amoebophrya sp. A120]|eukprot:GSA120T00015885001.1